jgi:hypothetical protein
MAPDAPPGTFRSGPLALHQAALFTDLYQLTRAAAYVREGMHQRRSTPSASALG